jgi:hypothetical protein
MKNLLISAFAFSLAMAAPTVLLAQDDHHDHPAPIIATWTTTPLRQPAAAWVVA